MNYNNLEETLKGLSKKNVKRMEKEDLDDVVVGSLDVFVDFILRQGRNKRFESQRNQIVKVLSNPKIAKSIKRIVKQADEFQYDGLNPNIPIVLYEVIKETAPVAISSTDAEGVDGETQEQDLQFADEKDSEVYSTYMKLIKKFLKKKIKEIENKTELDKDYIMDLLVVLPTVEGMSSQHIRTRLNRVLRVMYVNEPITDSDKIKDVLLGIIGKENKEEMILGILLEHRNHRANFSEEQLKVWNAVTNTALYQLEKMKKKKIRSIIEEYVKIRRRQEKDRYSARRIQFSSISPEEFPKIADVIESLKEKKNNERWL